MASGVRKKLLAEEGSYFFTRNRNTDRRRSNPVYDFLFLDGSRMIRRELRLPHQIRQACRNGQEKPERLLVFGRNEECSNGVTQNAGLCRFCRVRHQAVTNAPCPAPDFLQRPKHRSNQGQVGTQSRYPEFSCVFDVSIVGQTSGIEAGIGICVQSVSEFSKRSEE